VGTDDAKRPLGRRLVPLYEWWRHPQATLAGWPAAPSNSVMHLSGSKYLLLETERAKGTQAPTPMWFAAIDERVFLRTEAGSPKVRRISKQPIVKVAACRMRGKPVGGYLDCMARIVPPEREGEAEAALRRGYGLLRRLFNLVVHNDHTYLELTPLAADESVPEDEAQAAAVRAIREGRREQHEPPPAGAA
jgi:PPOX class probable F420-dependent enzyme